MSETIEYPQTTVDLSWLTPQERRDLSHALARAQVHQAVAFIAYPPAHGHGDTVFNDLGVIIAALDADAESCRLGGWSEQNVFLGRELTELIRRLEVQGETEQPDGRALVARLLAQLTFATGWTPPAPPAPRIRPGRVVAV